MAAKEKISCTELSIFRALVRRVSRSLANQVREAAVAKQFSVKYWPAVVIIIVSVMPAVAFCELARTMPCLCDVVVRSARILAVVLRQFCPVAGLGAPLSTCIWGSLKAFEVLLHIGEAVRPLACAAIT